MSIIDEANILVKSWSGHLDAPTSELRMIENLIQEIDQIKEVSENRSDLLLKAEAKIEKMNIFIKPLIEVRKSYHQWLKPLEEIYFKELMKLKSNNQSKVSIAAGLNRGTIRKKLKQFNLI